MLDNYGRILVLVGAGLVLLGLVLVLLGKVPGIGRLPGDIVIRRGNVTLFIPLGTMLLLSLVLTVILNLLARLRK